MKLLVLSALIISHITSNILASEPSNVLIIDNGIDTSHELIRDFNISNHGGFSNDHGSHLFCILSKNLNNKQFKFTSINYKKFNISEIKKIIKDKRYDYVLYASSGQKFQKKELEILISIIKNNSNTKIVTSSGNNSINLDQNPIYPCSYNISNIECIGNQFSYSNYGSKVKKIPSPKLFESCSTNNKYSKKYGTSQSAALYLNKLLLTK